MANFMLPDFVVVFELEGTRRRLEYRKVAFSAWGELKRELGFTPTTLIDSIPNFDIEAIGGVIWLERKQTERSLRWSTVRRELDRDAPKFQLIDILVNGVAQLSDEEILEDLPGDEPEEAGPIPLSGESS